MKTDRLLFAILLLATGVQAQAPDMTSGASPARWERPVGYLAEGDYPNGVALLPPPPAPDSAALARDEALNREALELQGSDRWKLAARDAIPDPAGTFACSLGMDISAESMPVLANLLQRVAADVGAAVTPTKKHYQRARPFMVNEAPTCVPRSEERTALDGSYPSGHTAAGWAWALILAELVPGRMDAVLGRGREFGQSRAICNLHWQSDIDQGRIIASALVARLHANADFRADLEKARAELTTALDKDSLPRPDCAAEARALAQPTEAP